jgi:hypothetical protein
MEDDENSANNDPISSALGLTPIQKNTTTIVNSIMNDSKNDTALKDFETARMNIQAVIENAKDAINELAEVATASQAPRAYEVLAKLIDTTVNANKSLLDMQKQIRELNNIESSMNKDTNKTINNNLFVGSTAEMQKILKEIKDNG